MVSAWPVKLAGVLSARQTSTANPEPIAASSDVWATVISNVAPIMALVGERNAKEFLRVSSSHDQLLLMATAPLGILSLMISAIRLSGLPILRRLTGREADPKSEALVELTPLSVAPATSVYAPHAVEIRSIEQRDEVAFVCAHIRQTSRVDEAITSFKQILRSRVNKPEGDSYASARPDQSDYEIVLGMKGNELSADETADLVSSILRGEEIAPTEFIRSTSLSFGTTGISPTQTAAADRATSKRRAIPELPTLRNAFAGICSFLAMTGVQVAGYYHDGLQIRNGGLKTLIMGLVGYCGIALFTFMLLVVIKQEIEIKPQDLGPIFDDENVVWTFSDSRHAQHQTFDKPPLRSLVQAAPRKQQSSQTRQVITSFVSAGLMGSYVVYYLGARVAVWWVAFAQLWITWVSAYFRACSIRGFLTAKDREPGEHWLGIFRDDLSESLLETVATMEHKTVSSNASLKSDGSENTKHCSGWDIRLSEFESEVGLTESCTLVVAKPIRQSLRNWSGCEDVMKVALEMAKHVCQSQMFHNPGRRLRIPGVMSFQRIIRFRLMVYVPGVLWKANNELDYILTGDHDLPNLYRDILKIFHLCSDVIGTITRHKTLTKEASAKVSRVLCGPLAPIPESDFPDGRPITLTHLLVNLRDRNTSNVKAYTLDQSLLLPTIQLVTMYESFPNDCGGLFSPIQKMQNGHTDKLVLDAEGYLPTLEAVFEDHEIWQHFMAPKPPQESSSVLQPRDETSGLYGKPARRDAMKKEKRKERSWLQDMAFRNRPGNPGQ